VIKLIQTSYRYDEGSPEWALKNIDLLIGKGEYVLVCGKSGSGKSTLGYLLNGLIPHFFDGRLQGTAFIRGEDTRHVTVADLMASVGFVFQNADAQLFNGTVEKELAFGPESLGVPPDEIESQIESTAEELHIEHLLDRSPTALSGGEKRLVAIASVLSLNPPIMVLDEPLAHLDWKGAERVRNVLFRLHEKGTTLVVIEQRLSTLRRDATRCLVLEKGELLFDGSSQAAHQVLQAQHLLPRYPRKTSRGKNKGSPLIQALEISHTFEKRTVLRDLSLEVKEGEILAVVGPNGAGKTTLVKHLNGLLRPSRGTVLYRGKGLGKQNPVEIAKRIGVSFQNPNDQFFKTTVESELAVGWNLCNKTPAGWFETVCEIFHLGELLAHSPYRLSEGQKKRVSIASVLVMNPCLLILDEPTVGQDGLFLETLAGLLVALRDKGLTIVIVTHDLEFAQAVAERWIVLLGGKVVAQGAPEVLGKDENLLKKGALGISQWIPGNDLEETRHEKH
jgi:energy-coupling factor transporter ATP-binding protein EcfA2